MNARFAPWCEKHSNKVRKQASYYWLFAWRIYLYSVSFADKIAYQFLHHYVIVYIIRLDMFKKINTFGVRIIGYHVLPFLHIYVYT